MSSPDDYKPGENGKIHNPLAVMQDGEKVIFEVRRHPVGLFFIYGAAGAFMIFTAVLLLIIVPNTLGSGTGAGHIVSGLVFFLLTIATLAFVFISTIIYWGNHWIVTSDSLTQTMQQGLFRKKSAQLSLGHIEDVTADKHGFLPHIFNYGIVMVETAGESGKFQFPYCPNPSFYAQKILAAKEDLSIHGHDKVSVGVASQQNSRPPVEQLGQAAIRKVTSE